MNPSSRNARPVAIFGAAAGVGANDPRCSAGPDSLLASGIAARLARAAARDIVVRETYRDFGDTGRSAAERLVAVCDPLHAGVREAVASGAFPVVFGGDHTVATGTWAGVADALEARGKFGLIWVDAHLDGHTPETTETGNLHGMALAALLGLGDHPLAHRCGRVLSPEHVCIIGARSYEEGEVATFRRLGVRVIRIGEIHEKGLLRTMEEALRIVSTGTTAFGVSFDLDSIDPEEAPGVGLREPDGLHAPTLRRALAPVFAHPLFAGFEIVEFNPVRDNGDTLAVAEAVLTDALAGRPPEPSRVRECEDSFGAKNYAAGPVTLVRGRGVHVWDEDGRRYLDMMSAYSAVSHGHAHPRLVAELRRQAGTLAVTSRAFLTDRLGPFLEKLCTVTGMARALPMNTGAEAVETALKAARKWAYRVKGVPPEQAEIIGCHRNFHGRTIAIVGLSTEPQYRDGFGAFPGGLKTIPYGDPAALEAAITPRTAAFLVEPIQGEGGIIVPPAGYLKACAEICRKHDVLLLVDEIQTGLGRTGKPLCCDHDGVKPDGLMLGKALGGGLLPVSMFLAREDVMEVFTPGDHGSTFGGNPLACAVAHEALKVLEDERLAQRAMTNGPVFMEKLRALKSPLVKEIRGRGLLVGLEVDPARGSAKELCKRLRERGLLTKETHETVIRFAPPLVITPAELDEAVAIVADALAACSP